MKHRAKLLDRRAFLGTLGLLAAPAAAGAQSPPKMPRVGVLGQGMPPAAFASTLLAQALHDLGWVDGQNLRFTGRYAQGRDDRLPALAAELVDEGVDVLFTLSTPAATAARQATSTLPIVFAYVNDPVASRLATSLSRPGWNATGVTTLQLDVARKLLQLFREALPNLVRVGVLFSQPQDRQGARPHDPTVAGPASGPGY